jgi:pyruvate dehydrogenase E2 component (dihydrolipoamide acetyltransferase)
MATPVIMPKLEMSQEAATIIEWLKKEGERIKKGEPLLAVETDKVTVEIESPASGVLAGIRAQSQQVVPVTQIIAYILQPGEALPPITETAGPVVAPSPAAASIVPTMQPATPVARRLAVAQGVDLSTVVGTGPGGRITKGDVDAALAAPSGPGVEPPPERVRATPAARRVARERGVDLSAVPGSGPRGRVQAADVLAFGPAAVTAGVAEVIPLQGMRRTIAERLSASYRTAPHITLTVRVDMSELEATRARLNARSQVEAAGGPHVSLTALIVKAVAWALKRHPWLNSTLREEAIHLLPEINVGVAVALPQGLIVPTVFRADQKGVAEIATEVQDLTVRAREGRLAPGDVAGGTFTVTNLGPLGIEQFTAIINPPQAAILAVGATRPEVVADDIHQVTVRPVLRLTLSADHRIVDGAVAAHFLNDLREALETPALLLW